MRDGGLLVRLSLMEFVVDDHALLVLIFLINCVIVWVLSSIREH